jgi:hypothetical protein
MAEWKRRKRVIIHIDTPPRAKTNRPFDVFINASHHGDFRTEQEALDYVYDYLKDPSIKLLRLYVS